MLSLGYQGKTTRIISNGVGLLSTSGTGSAVQAAAVTLPANSVGANSIIRVTHVWGFTGTTAARTVVCNFGGTAFYNFAIGSTVLSCVAITNICMANSLTAQRGGNAGSSAYGLGTSTSTFVSASVDTRSDVTIQFTANLNAADTFSLLHYTVEVLP